MSFFKKIGGVINDVGNFVGDVAKTAVEIQTKIVTEPIKAVANIAQLQAVTDTVIKIEQTTKHIAGGAINGVINKVTDAPITLLNAADKVVQGEIGNALEELKNGAIRQTIAYNPLVGSVMDVMRTYRGALQEQAKNRWQNLPENLINILGQHYNFDLRKVRFATNINTVHGQATTFEYEIFFPTELDLHNYGHLWWMLHELEHTQQYQDVGGFEPFMMKYLLSGAAKIIEHRSVNIHDEIPLEVAADAKANQIIANVFAEYVAQPVTRLSI